MTRHSVLTLIVFLISFVSIQNAQAQEKKNPYSGLRNMALGMDSKTLGLTEMKNDNEVYGIITDLEMSGFTVTITAFKTGDTSVYLSNGAGFIGAGQHESVSKITKKFVKQGNEYISKGKLSEDVSLPQKDNAVFYLLTNKGRVRIEEKISKMESMSSDYSELFIQLNEVMNQVRLKSE